MPVPAATALAPLVAAVEAAPAGPEPLPTVEPLRRANAAWVSASALRAARVWFRAAAPVASWVASLASALASSVRAGAGGSPGVGLAPAVAFADATGFAGCFASAAWGTAWAGGFSCCDWRNSVAKSDLSWDAVCAAACDADAL